MPPWKKKSDYIKLTQIILTENIAVPNEIFILHPHKQVIQHIHNTVTNSILDLITCSQKNFNLFKANNTGKNRLQLHNWKQLIFG